MNKKFTIIFVIIMVLLVAGSFIFRKTLSVQGKLAGTPTSLTKPTITSNPTQTIDAIVEAATTIDGISTANWKTFTSSNGSYSYKYPSGAIPSGIYGKLTVNFLNGGIDGEYPDTIEKKAVTIGGIPATESLYIYKGSVRNAYIVFDESIRNNLSKKSNFYWISIYIHPEADSKSKKYLLLGEKMVSTIKFLK